MKVPHTRAHALFMAAINLCTTLLLFLMCLVNADYGYPNELVALLGPVGASGFALWSVSWLIAGLRVRPSAQRGSLFGSAGSSLVRHW